MCDVSKDLVHWSTRVGLGLVLLQCKPTSYTFLKSDYKAWFFFKLLHSHWLSLIDISLHCYGGSPFTFFTIGTLSLMTTHTVIPCMDLPIFNYNRGLINQEEIRVDGLCTKHFTSKPGTEFATHPYWFILTKKDQFICSYPYVIYIYLLLRMVLLYILHTPFVKTDVQGRT